MSAAVAETATGGADVLATAVATETTAASAMIVGLREFLAGHLARRALQALEDALNGPVKECLRTAFPNAGDGPEAEAYATEVQKNKEETAQWEADVEVAYEEQTATHAAATAAPKKRSQLRKEATRAKRAHEKLLERPPPPPPMDVWLRKARSVLGARMRPHAHAEGAWDTHTLVAVLKGFFEEVFARRFGIDDVLEAKGLLSRLLMLFEARARRAHGAMPTESETLDLLHNVAAVLRRCGLSGPATDVEALLEEAKGLVEAACKAHSLPSLYRPTEEEDEEEEESSPLSAPLSWQTWRSALSSVLGWYNAAEQPPLADNDDDAVSREREVAMSAADQQALLLYRAMSDFEQRLQQEAGEFEYKGGTITFGERLCRWSAEDQQLVKRQAAAFRAVTRARHWLFHHTASAPDVGVVLSRMGNVLQALRGSAARNSAARPMAAPGDGSAVGRDWPWTSAAGAAGVVAVQLQLSAGGMRIPMPEERCLVGRQETIDQVTRALLSCSNARVLVHGLPGMGKDVVAAEVVRSEAVAAAGLQLQHWLQASTDTMLRQQLVDLFRTQLPKVVREAGDKEEDQLAAIRRWLEAHDGWLLVVEDAGWASRALWEYVPTGRGRLLVTSQAPLSRASERGPHQSGWHLEWTATYELEALSVEDSLSLLQRMNLFSHAAAAGKSLETFQSEEELLYVCRKLRADHVYSPPSADESEDRCKERFAAVICAVLQAGGTAKARKLRHRHVNAAQQEYRQLVQHSTLRLFLTEELGNVPLLVALCGHLLRSIGSVDGLMEHYKSAPLQQIDRDGRNPTADRHYLGTVRSVLVLLRRLQGSHEPGWPLARRLLCALALLPSRTTPSALFTSPGTPHAVVPLEGGGTVVPMSAAATQRYEAAARLLVHHGLAKDTGKGRAPAVHQLVQRVLREQLAHDETFLQVRGLTRKVILMRLHLAEEFVDYRDTRRILPCAEWWCDVSEKAGLQGEEEERRMLEDTARVLRGQGDAAGAARLQERLVQVCTTEQEQHAAMIQLSGIYHDLGRVKEASYMREELLAFERRDPIFNATTLSMRIAELCHSYIALDKCDEAVVLAEEAMQLLRKFDKDNVRAHLSVLSILATSYYTVERTKDALLVEEDVLRLQRGLWPPDHTNITTAMGNLALSYADVGKHEDAARMQEEVLAIRRRTLPPGHPHIATVRV